MISLKHAIDVLGLTDDDMVYVCRQHYDMFAMHLTVLQIKEQYDINRTKVVRIFPTHYKYSNQLDWEFII